MKIINPNQDIKAQFEKEGLAYPRLKSSKKWGLKGSTLLDRETEEESVKVTLDYLENRGLIELIV